MSDKDKIALLALIVVGVLASAILFVTTTDVAVLNPKGPIGDQERHLIATATLLMLIVVVPVYLLLFGIAWRYREGNKKAKYSPELAGNRKIELAWWAIPGLIICALSVVAWNSSHQLDPFKPLAAKTADPVDIQVVALNWKWLFIYPKQNIASVNFVEFPVNTPVNFKITSEGPMNSFWVPQLSGQIYAMAGMVTQLHIEASQVGDYAGSSANISGRGFAGMKFTARAASQADYDAWLQSTKHVAPRPLTTASYRQLAAPSENSPVTYYAPVENDLFNNEVVKFLRPVGGQS